MVAGEQRSRPPSGVAVDVRLEDRRTGWQQALSASVSRDWPRVRKIAFGSLFGAFVLCCALLAAFGYPTWRTVAFGCVGLSGNALYVLSRRPGSRLPRWGDDDFSLAFYFACSLLTGGLHSPIVVAGLGPLTRSVQGAGLRGPSAWRLGAIALALGGLVVAPSSLVGPPPPHLAYAPAMLAFLIPTIVLHVWRSSVEARTLEGMIGQVFRAREEVGSRALARARDLELLTARMSEELNDPLGEVRRRVDGAAAATSDPDAREQLGLVSSEIARMRSILEEYVSFSRPLESLRPESLRLGELADEVLGALEGRADAAGVELRRVGDGRVLADRRRVTEALLNLVANAIEATPPAGRVAVEIAERGPTIRLIVRDSGKGMSPDVLARLGSPFFTTRQQGTGLGVLLARSVFTRHGGSLDFQSTPGRGTAAIGVLPGSGVGETGVGAPAERAPFPR
jgi:signal transduction histidine kinase